MSDTESDGSIIDVPDKVEKLSDTSNFVNVYQFIALRVKSLVDTNENGLTAWKVFASKQKPKAQDLATYLETLDGASGKVLPDDLDTGLADLGNKMNDIVAAYFITNQASGTNLSLGSSVVMQAVGYELIRQHKMSLRVYNPVIWERCFQVKMLANSDLTIRRRAFSAVNITWQLFVIDKVAQKPVVCALYKTNMTALIPKLDQNVEYINDQVNDGSTIKSSGKTTDTSVSVWTKITAGNYFDNDEMSIF